MASKTPKACIGRSVKKLHIFQQALLFMEDQQMMLNNANMLNIHIKNRFKNIQQKIIAVILSELRLNIHSNNCNASVSIEHTENTDMKNGSFVVHTGTEDYQTQIVTSPTITQSYLFDSENHNKFPINNDNQLQLRIKGNDQIGMLAMEKENQARLALVPFKSSTKPRYIVVKSNTGKRTFKCNLCLSQFKTKAEVIRHVSVHFEERPFNCTICQWKSKTQWALTSHMKMHTGERPHKCNVCYHAFARKYYLTEHMRIHSGEKPFQCQICLARYSRKDVLKKHFDDDVHSDPYPHKCSSCEKRFHTKKLLRKHFTQNHVDDKPLKCPYCKGKFSGKPGLIHHIRTHTGERPFKCEICCGTFHQKVHLKTHMRTHTGEKPFKCGVCGRDFAQSSHLVSHKRSHTGEKPYQCCICLKRFTNTSNLKKHSKKHTADLEGNSKLVQV